MNNKKTLQSNLLLVLTALIWGAAFVAQHAGNEIGSFTFNAVRSFVGGVALLPVILFFDKRNARLAIPKPPQDKKKLILGGVCCGTASGHMDPEHWWKFHGRTMDDFRAAVRAALKQGQ